MWYHCTKIKGIRCVSSSFRSTSLLSDVGKVYGKVLLKRIRVDALGIICDEQGGFRREGMLGSDFCSEKGMQKIFSHG